MTADNKPAILCNVYYSEQQRCIAANVWAANRGPSITLCLTEGEARELAASLIRAADKAPRVGTPADLGCEAL